MEKSSFHYIIYIRTTPEKLWQAFTERAFTTQFWAETWHETDWHPGSSWKLMIPDGRIGDQGKIIECDPGRKLVLNWQNEFLPDVKNEGPSTLTCEFEVVGSSVKFSLTHEIDRADSKLIAGVSEGWPHILSSLKSLIETGESLEETRKWPEGM